MWVLWGLEVLTVFVFAANEALQCEPRDSTRIITFCPHTCLTFCIYRESKQKSQVFDPAFIKAASLIILSKPKRQKSVFVWFCFLITESSPHLFLRFHSLFTATFLLIKSSGFPALGFPPPWLCFKGICVCSPTFRIWFLLGFSELSLSCFPS